MAYFHYLFSNRTKERLFSYDFFKIWAKRIVNFKSLIILELFSYKLRRKGAFLSNLSVISSSATIKGKLSNLTLGEESYIGDAYLALHSKIIIGKYCVINDGVEILTASHDVNDNSWTQFSKPIIIGDNVWIATNAIILPGVKIGHGAVIGAGSVVCKDVEDFSVVCGNPSREVKKRAAKEFSYSPVKFIAPFEAWIKLNSISIK